MTGGAAVQNRIKEAVASTASCQDCGAELESVWKTRRRVGLGHGSPWHASCERCAKQISPNTDWTPLAPCAACHRDVCQPRNYRVAARLTCGAKCSYVARLLAEHAERSLPPRTCKRCGTTFSPERRDERCCSKACVKALWRRKKAAGRSRRREEQPTVRSAREHSLKALVNSVTQVCDRCGAGWQKPDGDGIVLCMKGGHSLRHWTAA